MIVVVDVSSEFVRGKGSDLVSEARSSAERVIDADGPDAIVASLLSLEAWPDSLAVVGGGSATAATFSAVAMADKLAAVHVIHVGDDSSDGWTVSAGLAGTPAERWRRRVSDAVECPTIRVEDTTRPLASLGTTWTTGFGRSLAQLRTGRGIRDTARLAKEAVDALRSLPRPRVLPLEIDGEATEECANLWVAGVPPAFGPGLPLGEAGLSLLARELVAPRNMNAIRELLSPSAWKGASRPFDELIFDLEDAWELDGWVVPEAVGRRLRLRAGPKVRIVG